MEHVVVEVEELYDRRMGQDQPLQAGLVRQAEHAFCLPEPACPADRTSRAEHGERSRELPEREQADDQRGLPDEAARHGQPPGGDRAPGDRVTLARGERAALAQRRRRRDGQDGCAGRGLLPVQVEVDHARSPAACQPRARAPVWYLGPWNCLLTLPSLWDGLVPRGNATGVWRALLSTAAGQGTMVL